MSKKDLEDVKTSIIATLKGHMDEKEKASLENFNSLRKAVCGIRNDVVGVKQKQATLESENRALKHEVEFLRSDYRYESGKDRAANLLVYYFEEKVDEEEISHDQVSILTSNLFNAFLGAGIKILEKDLLSTERLGQEPQEGIIRPVRVKLSRPGLKKDIFEKSKTLYEKSKVRMANDLNPPQRKEMKEVVTVRKLLGDIGIRSRIKGFHLEIQGKEYNWVQALEIFNNLQAGKLRKNTREERNVSGAHLEYDGEGNSGAQPTMNIRTDFLDEREEGYTDSDASSQTSSSTLKRRRRQKQQQQYDSHRFSVSATHQLASTITNEATTATTGSGSKQPS